MSRRDLGSIKPKQADVINKRGDLVRGSSTGKAERLALGATDSFLGSDGTDTAFVVAATQAEQETGTATNKPVTPGRQQFHQSAAKAWVVFDGTAVTTDLTGVGNSYNITSVVDNATGDYTINFATDFSSIEYAFALSAEIGTSSSHSGVAGQKTNTARSAGAFPIFVGVGAAGLDLDYVSGIFFGDH